MPQYAFRAVDGNNYMVEGTVEADDPMQAGEQIRKMGYAPQSVRPVPPAPVAVASGYGGRPAPVDLTQDYVEPPAMDTNGILIPTLELGRSDMASRMAKLEPWERSVGVSDGTEPTQELNAAGVGPTQAMSAQNGSGYPGPTQTMPAYAGRSGASGAHAREGRPGGGAIPYGPGSQREVGLGQRALETLVYPIFSGVVIKQLAPFFRQFATLINAGLPLYQALVALESNTQNEKLKEIARAAQRQVQEGGRFSDVMAAYPWVFQPMQIELVRAGEMGGNLDQILLNIADYIEHELELRRLISRETMYPKIVLFVALMILGKHGLVGGQMALVSLVLGSMGKSTYTTGNYFWDTLGFGLLCLIPILSAVAIFRLFLFNVDEVREGYDTFKMYFPGIGKLVRIFSLAKFCRTFASLYRSGIPMGTALQISGNASGNAVLRKAAYRAVPHAEKGEMVSDSMRQSGLFPPLAVDMFRTGETSGNLDLMADKIADFYESEGKLKAHQSALIFGVVVFLLVAILVANAVIGQYTGMAHAEVSAGDE